MTEPLIKESRGKAPLQYEYWDEDDDDWDEDDDDWDEDDEDLG